MRRTRQTRTSSGHWNKLEDAVGTQLDRSGLEYSYERQKLSYLVPATQHVYTPDFILVSQSGKAIIIETKGFFSSQDRAKHLYVREAHPDADIRFVFSRSASYLTKAKKTTYALWCQRNRFLFADRLIPQAWLEE